MSEAGLAKKLAEAETRKLSLEQEKMQKLAANLEKVSLAQEKKEKKVEKKSAEVLEVVMNRLIYHCHNFYLFIFRKGSPNKFKQRN